MSRLRLLAASLTLLLCGCAQLPARQGQATGIDGIACVGAVAAPVPGLVEASNPALLGRAQAATGKGGVCSAAVYTVTAPVTVYRVFDSGNPHSRLGSWWALKTPSGTRADYRAANPICAEWSRLDRVVACEIRPGSQVVLGTTQSATCQDGSTYPKTADIQVFVPNDGRAGILHVGACSEPGPWPPAAP